MKLMARLGVWTCAAAFVLVSISCKNTATGMKRDAEENAKQAAELSAEARAKTQVAADKASAAAEKAAEATVDATRAASEAAGAAAQTISVKTALIADKRVQARGIDVDTDPVTKTIVLKGHVPTESQKTIAGQIASEKAAGYRVKNELTIGN